MLQKPLVPISSLSGLLVMNWENQHRAMGGSLSIDWKSLTFRFKKPGIEMAMPGGQYREQATKSLSEFPTAK